MSVVLYSQPGCQPCNLTKKMLEKLDIKYEVRDIRDDPEAFKRVQDLGYRGTPVVETSTGEHWKDFRPDRLKALVA